MLNRHEIEKSLSKTNSKVAAAFAVRAAMRVLPGLAGHEMNSSFGLRGEYPEKKLFAVMHSERAAFLQLISTDRFAVSAATRAAVSATFAAPVYASAFADAATAAISAAFAADAAARAAAPITFAATAAAPTAFAFAADAAAVAFNRNYQVELQEILLQELDLITHKPTAGILIKRKIMNVCEFLQKPLWLGEPPKNWQEDWQFFKQSVLSLDDGFSGFLDWFDDRIVGKPIDVELLEKQVLIPEEILNQDVASINAYLNSLTQANKALNRVRAIFMGHGTAGKTSLIRCLWHEKVVEGKEDMTPGIDIREWPVPESPVKAMLWDFGG